MTGAYCCHVMYVELDNYNCKESINMFCNILLTDYTTFEVIKYELQILLGKKHLYFPDVDNYTT